MLFFVTTFAVTEGRGPAYGDELYPQSTAWSVVHGRPPNLSVNGLFPENIPLERFFGPVSFRVAAAMIRLFGLRMLPWRAVCFLFGIFLITASTALLLRLSGAGQWIALGGASTVLGASACCIVSPGRWDPVTVGLIFGGILILLYAANCSAARLALLAGLVGIFFGLAVGSTPRALLPLTGVACGVIAAAYVDPVKRRRILCSGAVAALSSFVTDALLLAPLGMWPWNWLKTVRRLSQGDQLDTSPLLGGSWNPEFSLHKTVILLTGILLISGVIGSSAERGERSAAGRTARAALTVTALATLALNIAVISRFLAYSIFWLPFLVAASFSWISWESLRGKVFRGMIAVLVCLELLLPASLEVRRMHTAIEHWKGRDPEMLLTRIRGKIPRGSIVFGPDGGYFYPVEQSGSRYLYLDDDITPGLARGEDSPAYLDRAVHAAECTAPTFSISSRDGEAYESADLVIKQFAVPGDCSSVEFDLNRIKPFGEP